MNIFAKLPNLKILFPFKNFKKQIRKPFKIFCVNKHI